MKKVSSQPPKECLLRFFAGLAISMWAWLMCLLSLLTLL